MSFSNAQIGELYMVQIVISSSLFIISLQYSPWELKRIYLCELYAPQRLVVVELFLESCKSPHVMCECKLCFWALCRLRWCQIWTRAFCWMYYVRVDGVVMRIIVIIISFVRCDYHPEDDDMERIWLQRRGMKDVKVMKMDIDWSVLFLCVMECVSKQWILWVVPKWMCEALWANRDSI